MSLVVVGLSHRTADVNLLERTVLDPVRDRRLTQLLHGAEHLREHLALSTCNRLEVYAEADAFHGAVSEISQALAQVTGVGGDELREHLFAHFEERAVAHLFEVAAGLDSVAIGESQILGQLREALARAQRGHPVSGELAALAQQALRVGKRVHTETGIDQVSRSLVERGLAAASERLGPVQDRSVVVVGAGAMSGLAAHTVARAGARDLIIVNRTHARAQRLAEATGGRAAPWAELTRAVADADVLISCTGALGHVITQEHVPAGRTRVLVDLGLPRDVDPALGLRDDVLLMDLEALADEGTGTAERSQVQQVQDLVTAAVADFILHRRELAIIPTVAALRSHSTVVLDAELDRLQGRLHLDDDQLAQVRLAMHRVAEKILHTPTVRMKELAAREDGSDATALMRLLFDLDPHESRVSRLPDGGDLV